MLAVPPQFGSGGTKDRRTTSTRFAGVPPARLVLVGYVD